MRTIVIMQKRTVGGAIAALAESASAASPATAGGLGPTPHSIVKGCFALDAFGVVTGGDGTKSCRATTSGVEPWLLPVIKLLRWANMSCVSTFQRATYGVADSPLSLVQGH